MFCVYVRMRVGLVGLVGLGFRGESGVGVSRLSQVFLQHSAVFQYCWCKMNSHLQPLLSRLILGLA